MYVPKWPVRALIVIIAVSLGWMAKDSLGWVAAGATGLTAPVSVPGSVNDDHVEALAARSTQFGTDSAAPAVTLRIADHKRGERAGDNSDGADPAATETPTSRLRSSTWPTGASGVRVNGATTGTGRESTPSTIIVDHTAAALPRARGAIGEGLHRDGRTVGSSSAIPPRTYVDGRNVEATTRTQPAQSSSGSEFSLYLTPETAATAIGEHIVIAYDGSIVLVGDKARLDANTGEAAQGAVVALDAQSSRFSTNSPETTAAQERIAARTRAAPVPGASTAAGSGASITRPNSTTNPAPDPLPSAVSPLTSPIASLSPGRAVDLAGFEDHSLPNSTTNPAPDPPPSAVSPLTSPIVSFSSGRAVDLAGFEDHSLSVRGQRDVVTYDDSNVFIDRDGKINGNTGDTDSAGLNAVDTVRSEVSAGPHCDDGCDNESIIQAKAGVFDEGDVAVDGHGNVVFAPEGDAGDGDAGDGGDDADDADEIDDGDDVDDDDDDRGDDPDVSVPGRLEALDKAGVLDELGLRKDLETLRETGVLEALDPDSTRATLEAAETREGADSTREAADSTREAADSTREAADSGGASPLAIPGGDPEAFTDFDTEQSPAVPSADPRQNPNSTDPLVIGGDGYDDLGIRVDGDDQVVTYDDSNVVLGGEGKVNAQIGDSDTGGTVAMGTVDSKASGGNSR